MCVCMCNYWKGSQESGIGDVHDPMKYMYVCMYVYNLYICIYIVIESNRWKFLACLSKLVRHEPSLEFVLCVLCVQEGWQGLLPAEITGEVGLQWCEDTCSENWCELVFSLGTTAESWGGSLWWRAVCFRWPYSMPGPLSTHQTPGAQPAS